MTEMLEGFLACIGVALFLGFLLAELRAILLRLASGDTEDEAGAPEGDQIHFRLAGAETSRTAKPICPAERRRRQ